MIVLLLLFKLWLDHFANNNQLCYCDNISRQILLCWIQHIYVILIYLYYQKDGMEMAFSNNLSSLKLLENTYLKNQAPLFYNSISYIEILNKRLEAKNTSNHSGSILNPYLLYGSGKIDVTNSLIRNNFPYLIRMENTFKLSSSVSLKLAQPSDLNLGSKLMAELQLEFKDLKGIPFIQAVMAKHNSVFVTVGLTISVQTWPKKNSVISLRTKHPESV